MPHQCVRCNELYEDKADEIVNGCKCGGKMFFFIRKEMLEKRRKQLEENKLVLSEEDANQAERDIQEIIGVNQVEESPVILDVECIKILGPGKYEIDIAKLFNKSPKVYNVGEGKYIIDLAGSFKD